MVELQMWQPAGLPPGEQMRGFPIEVYIYIYFVTWEEGALRTLRRLKPIAYRSDVSA